VSCARTAELTETFGMLSQAGPGKMYYIRCRCLLGEGAGALLRVSGQLKTIVKHRILTVG